MNLDYVFEDLEAQFAAEREAAPDLAVNSLRFSWLDSNVLNVQLCQGQQHRLIAPMFGKDFVAGLIAGSDRLLILANAAILRLTFETQPRLPPVRLLDCKVSDFLNQFEIPAAVLWRQANQVAEHSGFLVDAREGFVFLAEAGAPLPFALPFAQLSSLQVQAAEIQAVQNS